MTTSKLLKPRPKNVLRTILFVAGHGLVGTSSLARMQQSLPAGDWGDVYLGDWNRLDPLLAWCSVITGRTRTRTVRDLLAALAPDSSNLRLRDDVLALLGTEQTALEGALDVPVSELAVRLTRKRSREVTSAYQAALELLRDPVEARRLGDEARPMAVLRLREALDAMVPVRLFEAADGPDIARAILRTESSFRLRQDRAGVALSVFTRDRIQHLYVSSRLTKSDLAAALGVPPSALRRASIARRDVRLGTLDEARASLQVASRAVGGGWA
jgi:hypothetical protein